MSISSAASLAGSSQCRSSTQSRVQLAPSASADQIEK